MNASSFTRGLLLASILPLAAAAQTSTTTPPPDPDPGVTYGPASSRYEVTLGGSGATNTDFDSSLGGVNFSVGTYFNDSLLGSIRQAVNYSNPDNAGTSWGGSTFLALDQHFGSSALRPLVGVNIGRIYGDNVHDTWAAGLEAGAKFYVQSRTFVYGLAQYAWLFDDGDDIDDTFDDGQILWTVGIGFNF